MQRLPFVAASLLAALAVSACTKTQDILEPSSIAAAPPSDAAVKAQGDLGMAPPTTASTTGGAPLTAAIAARTKLRIDPIVGASVEAATPLTEQLANRARARGIGISGSADPSSTHVLKGYFSVITEGSDTTVIYVWDVYDAAGNRLHRINGQQKGPANGGQGWASVSTDTMQKIADVTIDQFAAWLAGNAA